MEVGNKRHSEIPRPFYFGNFYFSELVNVFEDSLSLHALLTFPDNLMYRSLYNVFWKFMWVIFAALLSMLFSASLSVSWTSHHKLMPTQFKRPVTVPSQKLPVTIPTTDITQTYWLSHKTATFSRKPTNWPHDTIKVSNPYVEFGY